MKILYLHRTQGRGVEGVHIRGIADAMRAEGHEVALLGPEGADPYAKGEAGPPGLAARFAKLAPELVFEAAELAYDRRLRARLRDATRGDAAPDLIYERYAFFAGAGSDLAAELGVPHVVEVNYTGEDPLVRSRSRLLGAAARRLEDRVFGRAAVLAPVSSRLRERLVGRGLEPARLVLTPNAVSRSWWERAADVAPEPLPDAFAGLPVTGFVGGFYSWHGLDRLVEAARRCRDAGNPTALLLVGDGPEREPIRRQIAAAGLETLALLPGAKAHEQLAPWIAAMDVCVMPHSNDYGSPMKIFEYMALGRAVLAPDLPPLRDAIASGKNGLLFGAEAADDDPAGPLAGALGQLLFDDEFRHTVGAAARVSVGERHTWEENWRRLRAALPAGSAAAPASPEAGSP